MLSLSLSHTHTHARTHAHARARTRAHTHTRARARAQASTDAHCAPALAALGQVVVAFVCVLGGWEQVRDLGADVLATDADGQTALHLAARCGKVCTPPSRRPPHTQARTHTLPVPPPPAPAPAPQGEQAPSPPRTCTDTRVPCRGERASRPQAPPLRPRGPASLFRGGASRGLAPGLEGLCVCVRGGANDLSGLGATSA